MMERLIVITAYVRKVLKVDWFEAIMENFHNFVLEEVSEAESEVLNLPKDFTYDIILIQYLPRSLRWVKCRGRSCKSGSSSNVGVGLLLHTFKFEYMLVGSSSLLVLGFLAVDLENLQVLLLSQAWMKCLGRIDRRDWEIM